MRLLPLWVLVAVGLPLWLMRHRPWLPIWFRQALGAVGAIALLMALPHTFLGWAVQQTMPLGFLQVSMPAIAIVVMLGWSVTFWLLLAQLWERFSRPRPEPVNPGRR